MLLSAGCGGGELEGVDGSSPRAGLLPPDPCNTPHEGCACDSPGEVVDCGTVQRRSGEQVWCSLGHRSCGAEGKWSECASEVIREISVPGGDQAAQALGMRGKCLDDPCDPFCEVVVDDGADLDLPPGFQETVEGGITLTAQEGSINDTGCTSIELQPPEQTLTVTQLGSGGGLLGEYFYESFFSSQISGTATLSGTRLDPTIQFAWPGPPGVSDIGPDSFAVRWTGYVKPPVTGDYTLCVVANDGVRLWFDEQLVVDRWQDQFATEYCMATARTLAAGALYRVRMEYYERADGR